MGGSPWGCKESDMTEAAEGTHMCTHTHTNTHTRLLTDITGGRDSCIRYSTLPSTGNCLLTGHPQGSSRTLLPGVVQGGLTISVSPQPWGPYLGQSRSWGVTGPSADTRLPWDSRCHSCTLRRLLPTHWIPPHLGRQGSLILLAPRSPKALPVTILHPGIRAILLKSKMDQVLCSKPSGGSHPSQRQSQGTQSLSRPLHLL